MSVFMKFKYFSPIIACLALLSGCGPQGRGQLPKVEFSESENLADFSDYRLEYRVVSLPDSVNRRNFMSAQFNTLKAAVEFTDKANNKEPEVINVDFIDAIFGKDLDRVVLAREDYLVPGTLRDGELGLLRTTTENVLPLAMAMEDNAILTLFEDDVVIPADTHFGFRDALRAAPKDWDILFLGCNRDLMCDETSNVRSRFLAKRVLEGLSMGNLCPASARKPVPNTPWEQLNGECTPGTWAYALRNSSARKISDFLKESAPLRYPIDDIYRRLVEEGKLRAYCLDHDLVRPNFAMPSHIR